MGGARFSGYGVLTPAPPKVSVCEPISTESSVFGVVGKKRERAGEVAATTFCYDDRSERAPALPNMSAFARLAENIVVLL